MKIREERYKDQRKARTVRSEKKGTNPKIKEERYEDQRSMIQSKDKDMKIREERYEESRKTKLEERGSFDRSDRRRKKKTIVVSFFRVLLMKKSSFFCKFNLKSNDNGFIFYGSTIFSNCFSQTWANAASGMAVHDD